MREDAIDARSRRRRSDRAASSKQGSRTPPHHLIAPPPHCLTPPPHCSTPPTHCPTAPPHCPPHRTSQAQSWPAFPSSSTVALSSSSTTPPPPCCLSRPASWRARQQEGGSRAKRQLLASGIKRPDPYVQNHLYHACGRGSRMVESAASSSRSGAPRDDTRRVRTWSSCPPTASNRHVSASPPHRPPPPPPPHCPCCRPLGAGGGDARAARSAT